MAAIHAGDSVSKREIEITSTTTRVTIIMQQEPACDTTEAVTRSYSTRKKAKCRGTCDKGENRKNKQKDHNT